MLCSIRIRVHARDIDIYIYIYIGVYIRGDMLCHPECHVFFGHAGMLQMPSSNHVCGFPGKGPGLRHGQSEVGSSREDGDGIVWLCPSLSISMVAGWICLIRLKSSVNA